MALIQCLVLFTFIEVRTVKFFPHAESWLVDWNFRGASRMQGAGHVLYTHAITTRVHTTQMCTCCIPVHTFSMRVAKTNQPEHCCDKMRVAFARTCVCMQDMIRAHTKMKCKEKNGVFQFVYCSYAFVCVLPYLVVCTCMLLWCYSYVSRLCSCILVCYLWCFSHDL